MTERAASAQASGTSGHLTPLTGGSISFLCGSTAAFDAEKLAGLYPSRSEYLKRFEAATAAAVAAGFLLAEDAPEITAIAAVNFPC